MTAKYLLISFKFSEGPPKVKELEPVFDNAIDWFRYSSTAWIVWSTSDSERWYERLRPHISDKDSMFIAALDAKDRQGWMSKSFWDWINQNRSKSESKANSDSK